MSEHELCELAAQVKAIRQWIWWYCSHEQAPQDAAVRWGNINADCEKAAAKAEPQTQNIPQGGAEPAIPSAPATPGRADAGSGTPQKIVHGDETARINADAINDLRAIVGRLTGHDHSNTHGLDLTLILGHRLGKLLPPKPSPQLPPGVEIVKALSGSWAVRTATHWLGNLTNRWHEQTKLTEGEGCFPTYDLALAAAMKSPPPKAAETPALMTQGVCAGCGRAWADGHGDLCPVKANLAGLIPPGAGDGLEEEWRAWLARWWGDKMSDANTSDKRTVAFAREQIAKATAELRRERDELRERCESLQKKLDSIRTIV